MRRIIFLMLILASTNCGAETLKFVTFEAPPFMSPQMPEQGACNYALRKIFKKMGYDLEVSFAPLRRAIDLASKKSDTTGYFPVSPFELASGFISSKTIYQSPWVLVERKEKPVRWKKFRDLAKYFGGANVQYNQPPEIEKLKAEKILKIDRASDDTLNLLKLATKRLDYVLIDSTMFKFLISTDPRFKPYANDMQINEKPIQLLKYTVAFKKNDRNQKILKQFNEIASEDEFNLYIKEYFQHK